MDPKPDILLASSSPRRQQMLLEMGWDFAVITPRVDETPLPGEAPDDFALRAAVDKAKWVAAEAPGGHFLIIGADTVVTVDGDILGKPADDQDAARMLGRLNGRMHRVITGLSVLESIDNLIRKAINRTVVSQVYFRELTDEEITRYIDTGEPRDKAGAYGIQAGAAHMVESINGSYTNIVGLPLAELIESIRGICPAF
ncbi:MAG: septum formation protein Maf [Spartobacteria bacterium]|nr:septum formation protein Maf [Spartobacteria bacterium]